MNHNDFKSHLLIVKDNKKEKPMEVFLIEIKYN